MISIELTARQHEVWDYLCTYYDLHGIVPAVREIAKHFGFTSPNAITTHLNALEKKGYLRRMKGKARGLTLLRKHSHRIPVLGNIPAGIPVEKVQEVEGFIDVLTDALRLSSGQGIFALRVRGDSMVGANILDGDLAIMEQSDPLPGQIVAALVDGETSLKRYVCGESGPVLKAENPKFTCIIPVHELIIQGVMRGLLRVV
ncbi:MAG: transcriptional repressor, LexA family [Verrucomicrobiales bacterium]|nr:transcriptional repressor, LexA family [Verrucomicrobiales bacterium]